MIICLPLNRNIQSIHAGEVRLRTVSWTIDLLKVNLLRFPDTPLERSELTCPETTRVLVPQVFKKCLRLQVWLLLQTFLTLLATPCKCIWMRPMPAGFAISFGSFPERRYLRADGSLIAAFAAAAFVVIFLWFFNQIKSLACSFVIICPH